MNVGLEDAIRNTMDDSLRAYLDSEEYQQKTEEIELLTNKLKRTLSPDQVGLFMDLLDKISDCDGRFASESYVKGVFEGIVFHDKHC